MISRQERPRIVRLCLTRPRMMPEDLLRRLSLTGKMKRTKGDPFYCNPSFSTLDFLCITYTNLSDTSTSHFPPVTLSMFHIPLQCPYNSHISTSVESTNQPAPIIPASNRSSSKFYKDSRTVSLNLIPITSEIIDANIFARMQPKPTTNSTPKKF